MKTRKLKKSMIWLLVSLVSIFAFTRVAFAKYNPPTYSKVEVVRNPQGQSYLELKFHWSSEQPPNFDPGVAVEFEIHIDNKCFVQPVGGKDDDHNCDNRLGKNNYNLPNDLVGYPTNDYNCYVDKWNYWAPDAWTIAQDVEDHCSSIGSMTATCLFSLDGIGKVVDAEANFAVGLHEANRLHAGITYSFKYPVEINNAPECNLLYNGRIDEGLAWVNMQTFNNVCLLTPPCADYESLSDFFHPYTCPELIGADPACWNANKDEQIWLDNICVPTGVVNYTPVVDAIKDLGGVCEGRDHPGEHTENSCCIDNDDDGYYAKQLVSTWGTKTGDCKDNNNEIHPHATEIVNDGIDSDCNGNKDTVGTFAGWGDITYGPPIITSSCPPGSECIPPTMQINPCNGNGTQSRECLVSCTWGPWSACSVNPVCSPGQTASCGSWNCGVQTCDNNGQWGDCLYNIDCSPGSPQYQPCNGSGTQTRYCDDTCHWGAWGSCIQSCTDVYLASASPACHTAGGYEFCIDVQQVSGSNWQYRVCKYGGLFLSNYQTILHDDNHLWQLGDTYLGNAGDVCMNPWRQFSVSYLNGYGPANGAGVRADVLYPANCGQANCTFSTGTVTVRKECQ